MDQLIERNGRHPWTRFLCWDIVGEVLWVVLYVALGKLFSDRVQALVEILGDLAWVIVGLIAAVVLGWQLLRYARTSNAGGRSMKTARASA